MAARADRDLLVPKSVAVVLGWHLALAAFAARLQRGAFVVCVVGSFIASVIVAQVVVSLRLIAVPVELVQTLSLLGLPFLALPLVLLSSILFSSAIFVPIGIARRSTEVRTDRRARQVMRGWLLVMTALGMIGTTGTYWIVVPILSAAAGIGWLGAREDSAVS